MTDLLGCFLEIAQGPHTPRKNSLGSNPNLYSGLYPMYFITSRALRRDAYGWMKNS